MGLFSESKSKLRHPVDAWPVRSTDLRPNKRLVDVGHSRHRARLVLAGLGTFSLVQTLFRTKSVNYLSLVARLGGMSTGL